MRICDELSCQELVAFLDAYLAGELPPARREVFDWHLAVCTDCRNYLDSYRRTIELGREALRGSGEAAIPTELIQAILAARRG
jgi:anti-sigma factor RsiW